MPHETPVLLLALLLAGCARVELEQEQVLREFAARHAGCKILEAEAIEVDEASIDVHVRYACTGKPGEKRHVARYGYHDGTWGLAYEEPVKP